MVKKIKSAVTIVCLGLLLATLMAPPQALAAPKLILNLTNNRSEMVWVAISSWDFDKNVSHTRGWYGVKPNGNLAIPVGPKLDYPQSIHLYAKSNTRVWEGTMAELGECDDRVIQAGVRMNTKFECWDNGGWQPSWKDWKWCIFLTVTTDENGNLTYTFD